MNLLAFKKIFNESSKEHGFVRAYEGWFKEFPEIIQVLDLQKSNYGNLFFLNFKIFIKGIFGIRYSKSKKLVKSDPGDIFMRPPEHYSILFNLDSPMDDEERTTGLEKCFKDFILPLSEKTHSLDEIKNTCIKGELFVLPSIKKEVGIT